MYSSNPFTSAAKWILMGFLMMILMGFLLGMNLKDASWLYLQDSTDQADRANLEIAHQQQLYELQEQLAISQTEAEIRKIQREQELLDAQYQHQIQALDQELRLREVAFKTWLTVLTFVGISLSIALLIGSIFWSISKVLVHRQVDPPNPEIESSPGSKDRWDSPNYRHAATRRAWQEKRESKAANKETKEN